MLGVFREQKAGEFIKRIGNSTKAVFVAFRWLCGVCSVASKWSSTATRQIHFKQIGTVTCGFIAMDAWRYTTPLRCRSPVLLKSPRAIIIFHVGRDLCKWHARSSTSHIENDYVVKHVKTLVRALKTKFLFSIRFCAFSPVMEIAVGENYEEFFIVGTWKDLPRFMHVLWHESVIKLHSVASFQLRCSGFMRVEGREK